MKKKQILFVINTVQTMSGASKVMLSVAKAALTMFSKVTVIGILNTKDEDVGDKAIEFIPLGTMNEIKGLWRVRCIQKLRKIFKLRKPDIICSFVADACTMARLASFCLNVKVVSCERGDPYTTGKLWQFFMRFTYRYSDYAVFQLPSARDFFSEKVRAHSFVIPNPFIPKAEAINREHLENKTIVSAGRLFDKQKDFTSLIRSFAIVHNKYPDYRLVIYGEGSSRLYYEELISSLDLTGLVSLPGFVKNVSEEIKDKAIFVLSSVFEGIPNTLLEAMSMGLPCIATNCSPGGAEFLTQNGEYGILLDIGDVDGIAQSIIRFIEYPNEAYKLGMKAKGSISRFETELILSRWLQLFNKVLS